MPSSLPQVAHVGPLLQHHGTKAAWPVSCGHVRRWREPEEAEVHVTPGPGSVQLWHSTAGLIPALNNAPGTPRYKLSGWGRLSPRPPFDCDEAPSREGEDKTWASSVSGSEGSHGAELEPQASRQKEGRGTTSPRREPAEGRPSAQSETTLQTPGPCQAADSPCRGCPDSGQRVQP